MCHVNERSSERRGLYMRRKECVCLCVLVRVLRERESAGGKEIESEAARWRLSPKLAPLPLEGSGNAAPAALASRTVPGCQHAHCSTPAGQTLRRQVCALLFPALAWFGAAPRPPAPRCHAASSRLLPLLVAPSPAPQSRAMHFPLLPSRDLICRDGEGLPWQWRWPRCQAAAAARRRPRSSCGRPIHVVRRCNQAPKTEFSTTVHEGSAWMVAMFRTTSCRYRWRTRCGRRRSRSRAAARPAATCHQGLCRAGRPRGNDSSMQSCSGRPASAQRHQLSTKCLEHRVGLYIR